MIIKKECRGLAQKTFRSSAYSARVGHVSPLVPRCPQDLGLLGVLGSAGPRPGKITAATPPRVHMSVTTVCTRAPAQVGAFVCARSLAWHHQRGLPGQNWEFTDSVSRHGWEKQEEALD